MHAVFIGLDLFQCSAAAAECNCIRIKHQRIGALIGNADLIVFSADRYKIAHGDDLIAAVINAAERDDTLPVVIVRDPAEALPRIIILPERRRIHIELVERLGKFQQRFVIRIIEHEPFQFLFIIPLSALTELLPHKEQLLARMREHIAEECAVGGEFIALKTRHFLDHRALAVNNLIMRDRQDIVFGEAVEERECQLIVIECAVKRIHRHIGEHIVHPAHVPLEIEAQSADVGRLCDERPRSRFLRDHQHIGMPCEHGLIEQPQERDRFEIFSAAVDIRAPFAVAAVIVKIEHRSDCVHAQTVDVEFIEPPACRGDQERNNLRSAVVKDSGAPALVLAFERIGVFIEACAVEFVESLLVLREVCRHPVENDADARLMEHVDHLPKVIRCAEARGRGEIARDLIAP